MIARNRIAFDTNHRHAAPQRRKRPASSATVLLRPTYDALLLPALEHHRVALAPPRILLL